MSANIASGLGHDAPDAIGGVIDFPGEVLGGDCYPADPPVGPQIVVRLPACNDRACGGLLGAA